MQLARTYDNMMTEINFFESDTIAAIATATGGGIGIIRVSGQKSLAIVKKIFRSKNKEFEDRKLHYGKIIDQNDQIIDEALVAVMYSPKTYTKEDIVEIHCHGGIFNTKKILETVLQNGARLAEPGEFTKRAFLNGRLDLSQAEAVMDIISAKTEIQQRTAVSQLSGGLSKKVKACKDMVLDCLARIEAAIDYPEHETELENGAGTQTNYDIANQIVVIIDKINALLKTADSGRIIREGINTVIIGKPNVGKSSLLNALLDDDRAIVTDIPGTTRDTLTEYINLSGVLLKITDTAGIRETSDVIEKIGVERSILHAEQAELVLMILDSSSIDPHDLEILKRIENKNKIILVNKSDLIDESDLKILINSDVLSKYENVIGISAKKQTGLDLLSKKIREMFAIGQIDAEQVDLLLSVRHTQSLRNTKEQLKLAYQTAESGFAVDLISIDLQAAYASLGEITGDNAADDLIDRVFSKFCLGK